MLIHPASLSDQSTGVDTVRLALAVGTAQQPCDKWPPSQDRGEETRVLFHVSFWNVTCREIKHLPSLVLSVLGT